MSTKAVAVRMLFDPSVKALQATQVALLENPRTRMADKVADYLNAQLQHCQNKV